LHDATLQVLVMQDSEVSYHRYIVFAWVSSTASAMRLVLGGWVGGLWEEYTSTSDC